MTKILSDKYPDKYLLLLILHLAHSVTWSRVCTHHMPPLEGAKIRSKGFFNSQNLFCQK